jgi:isoleucyl-tRNA synthetase
MTDVDRYALARYAEAGIKARAAYDRYDFQAIVHTLNGLATVDLSAFYFDVSKDRLYTFGAASDARRSAQSAMYRIVEGLVRLLAPVLPVTCDELWRALPGPRVDSVHLADFPSLEDLSAWQADEAFRQRWERLLEVRDLVNLELEKARQAKVIGSSLEARVTIEAADDGIGAVLRAVRPGDLEALFIVSSVAVRASDDVPTDPDVPATGVGPVTVAPAGGVKCVRCWRYVPDVSTDPAYEGLCSRCVEAVNPTPREPAGA